VLLSLPVAKRTDALGEQFSYEISNFGGVWLSKKADDLLSIREIVLVSGEFQGEQIPALADSNSLLL
jgi:hypothetical protein